MIKEITATELGKKKIGWRFDRKRQLYITFQVRTTFDGKPHVRRGFATKRDAAEYLEQVKVQNRLIKIGYIQTVQKIQNDNENLPEL